MSQKDFLRSEPNTYKRSVHILGLGWLGVPLAKQIKCSKTLVNGTVRTKHKQNQLKSIQIDSELMQLDTNFTDYLRVISCLIQPSTIIEHRYVVVNIPPGRANFKASRFIKCMTKLIDDIFKIGVDKLIFISTTSVFGNLTGDITLNTKVQPVTESAIAHVEIEQYLLTQFADQSLIIRPAGLIGANLDGSYRHPIFSLVKKGMISQGDDAVNLIHQQDIINCIIRAIDLNFPNNILNVSSLEHPTRRDYYTWCANKLGLNTLEFFNIDQDRECGKIIRPEESLMLLGNLELEFPSPYNMLPMHIS